MSHLTHRSILNNRLVNKLMFCLPLLAVLFAVSGCRQKLQSGYGRPTGAGYSKSINGTQIFHQMLESSGHPVDRYGKFSPRWDKYKTVFWFPDSYSSPSAEAVAKIDEWLSADDRRKLIFIARDYDAVLPYWDQLASEETDDPARRDRRRREFHEAYFDFEYSRVFNEKISCQWFETAEYPYTTSNQVSGPWAYRLNQPCDISYRTLPKPWDTTANDTGLPTEYNVDVDLFVDDRPLVFSLQDQQAYQGEVVVVGNASFILNLPLANDGNRQLAEQLIAKSTEHLYKGESVLVVESEFSLPIVERDTPEVTSRWSWIAQRPLRYIVPYVLFCCLLFCFVRYPIFGRPKRPVAIATSNFRDHIEALGQLLKRTNANETMETWIEEARKQTLKKSNREK